MYIEICLCVTPLQSAKNLQLHYQVLLQFYQPSNGFNSIIDEGIEHPLFAASGEFSVNP